MSITILTDTISEEAYNKLMAYLRELVGQLPADHGLIHSEIVAARARRLYGEDNLLLNIAAEVHDLPDGKMKREDLWRECLEEVKKVLPNDWCAVEWIVLHIGVSREAGKDYKGRWSVEDWKREIAMLQSVYSEKELGEILRIRHCVSAADMLTALGPAGHWRSVEFDSRRQGLDIAKATPEQLKKLREDVRWIHEKKHLHICNWIHLESEELRGELEKGVAELVSTYNEWVVETGGEESEKL